MATTFKPYLLDQSFLLPPDIRDWLPAGHLALVVSDLVDELDLRAVFAPYQTGDGRGQPGYQPAMMIKLLVYAYCTGKPSSRRIERATYEEIPYRVLTCNQHPDHDSIATFRKRHLAAMAGLFDQVLRLACEAGLVKLGHVALDGTKVKANASKHKAMSYGRMEETEERLKKEIDELLAAAAAADAKEDAELGNGKSGDEIPEELRRRESRLTKIREAKAALEAAARERATEAAEAAEKRIMERHKHEAETGKPAGGREPEIPDPDQAKPDPKAQRNFTDPESRIMKDGASGGFEQCYNAQAVVDSASQIIVCADVTQQANDKQQLVPMLEKLNESMGRMPEAVTADAGYFSEAAVTAPVFGGVNLLVPPGRQKHGARVGLPATPETESKLTAANTVAPGAPDNQPRAKQTMIAKLAEAANRAIYAMRKAVVEPVFGQIKEARGFRRFSFRGKENVTAEWLFICATHNILKIFRSGGRVASARC